MALAVVLAAMGTFVFWPVKENLAHLASIGENYDVRILRDTWGVPHIFGKTDADDDDGLAFAHAEDDFLTIQQTLVAAHCTANSGSSRQILPSNISLSFGPSLSHSN